MNELALLLMLVGNWKGSSTLYLPEVPPDSNVSSINAVAVLNNTFIRMDYTWQYKNTPQEGSLLVGYAPKSKVAEASWIDSWHMGHQIMELKGTIDSVGAITLLGSYAAPPGPDWGWKIVIAPTDTTMHFVMYNILPDGEEFLAVDGKYLKE